MAEITNSVANSMDDIVFDERNKNYGAYQLRKDASKNLLLAMLISAAAVTAIIFAYSFYLQNREPEPEPEVMIPVEMKDVAMDEEAPKAEEIKVPPPEVEQIKFLPPDIVDIAKPDEIPPQDKLDSTANITDKDKDGKDTTAFIPDTDGNVNLDDKGNDDFLVTITEEAKYPGGEEAMYKFMQKKADGRVAEKLKVGGKVLVYFEIDKHGKMINMSVLRGFNKDCDAEALRVIKLMSENIVWEPAKLNGRAGKSRRTVPFKFTPPPEDE